MLEGTTTDIGAGVSNKTSARCASNQARPRHMELSDYRNLARATPTEREYVTCTRRIIGMSVCPCILRSALASTFIKCEEARQPKQCTRESQMF
jgi:hypothetical protein